MKSHPAIKPAVWGAFGGAVIMTIVGFWGLGWVLASKAEVMAQTRAEAATVAALAPICVAKFEAQPDVATKLAELKKASTWERGTLIEKGGWAMTPGTNSTNSAVANACAEKLGKAT
jgi:hypothetical protein